MLLAEIISVEQSCCSAKSSTAMPRSLPVNWRKRRHSAPQNCVGRQPWTRTGAIRLALSRADLVILGGGLGPTDDDLTREAIAAALGETPTEDPAQLAHLRGLYESSRGRDMPQVNRKQAWLIPSAEALANPVGTAPGWFVRTTPTANNRRPFPAPRAR